MFCFLGAVGRAGGLWRLGALLPQDVSLILRGVPWAPHPFVFLGLLYAVMCCKVFPQERCCLDTLVPFKRSALFILVLFWGQGFSGFSFGQDKIRSGLAHRTRLVLLHVFFGLFLGAACLSNLCGGLPRLAKICFAFCGRCFAPGFFCGLAPPLCGCFLGFRGSVGGGSLFSSLPLVSCCSFVFLVFGAATPFLMPRPLLR